ncbi:hypothetical protein ACFL1X_06795 [Candidatus Hydrogenedentota bacterium]
MITQRIIRGFLAAFFVCLLPSHFAQGWGNNLTHPEMTAAAVELSGDAESREFCWLLAGNGSSLPRPQCAWIDEGSAKEDLGYSPELILNPFPYWIGPLISGNLFWHVYEAAVLGVGPSWDVGMWGSDACGVDRFTWLSHAYNPVTGETWALHDIYGLLLGNFDDYSEDAIDRAEELWAKAFDSYLKGDKAAAYFMLGRVSHIVQDLAAPSHVHVDVHPLGDDVETWAEGRFNVDLSTIEPFVPTNNDVLADGIIVPENSVRGLLQVLSELTYDISAFHGELVAARGKQPDSELSAMFPSLHYQDSGVLGGGYWYMDDIGAYNPLDLIGINDWWPCEADHTADFEGPGGAFHISGNMYIRNAAGNSGTLTPAVFNKPGVYESLDNETTLLNIYGDILFPVSVEYNAGLIQMFRRDIIAGNFPAYEEDYSGVAPFLLPMYGLLAFFAAIWEILVFLASLSLQITAQIPAIFRQLAAQLFQILGSMLSI